MFLPMNLKMSTLASLDAVKTVSFHKEQTYYVSQNRIFEKDFLSNKAQVTE